MSTSSHSAQRLFRIGLLTLRLRRHHSCRRLEGPGRTLVHALPHLHRARQHQRIQLPARQELSDAPLVYTRLIELQFRADWMTLRGSNSQYHRGQSAVVSGSTLAAANLGPTLPSESLLNVARRWPSDSNGIELMFDVRNSQTVAVEIEALGAPLEFNNIFTGRTAAQTNKLCSLFDPYIGRDTGYVQVVPLLGTLPPLLGVPAASSPLEGWHFLPEDGSNPPYYQSQKFEGLHDWQFHMLPTHRTTNRRTGSALSAQVSHGTLRARHRHDAAGERAPCRDGHPRLRPSHGFVDQAIPELPLRGCGHERLACGCTHLDIERGCEDLRVGRIYGHAAHVGPLPAVGDLCRWDGADAALLRYAQHDERDLEPRQLRAVVREHDGSVQAVTVGHQLRPTSHVPQPVSLSVLYAPATYTSIGLLFHTRTFIAFSCAVATLLIPFLKIFVSGLLTTETFSGDSPVQVQVATDFYKDSLFPLTLDQSPEATSLPRIILVLSQIKRYQLPLPKRRTAASTIGHLEECVPVLLPVTDATATGFTLQRNAEFLNASRVANSNKLTPHTDMVGLPVMSPGWFGMFAQTRCGGYLAIFGRTVEDMTVVSCPTASLARSTQNVSLLYVRNRSDLIRRSKQCTRPQAHGQVPARQQCLPPGRSAQIRIRPEP
ncbi:unnamed protein product [Mycena citricolor]|uniref:Uncharacterized protein n=1 Tax=Mycena citricolor TaxID=2018698 RepID=A0AAD2HBW6_9AGAR|nr:unnamed protein product [Mycena citricolor]